MTITFSFSNIRRHGADACMGRSTATLRGSDLLGPALRPRRIASDGASRLALGVMMFVSSWLAIAATILAPAIGYAELVVEETDSPNGRLTTFKITVTPAAEPSPALKHRLILRDIDLRPGNAAPYYYRALLGVKQASRSTWESFGDAYDEWYDMTNTPLDRLPLEKMRSAASIWNEPFLGDLREAAVRRDCDWEWNFNEIRGPQTIAFRLEEIQEARSLHRALMLHARLALAERRTNDALDFLRLNYRLAVDVAREPILVCDLTGIAIAMNGQFELIELISQSDAPNLYWALSELPRPLINIRKSIQSEMSTGLRMFPFFLDAETAEHSPEEWSRLLVKAYLDLRPLMDDGGVEDPSQFVQNRAGVAAMSLAVYPAAKRRLIQGGMAPEQVERMPVGQVMAIDASREYRRIADEMEKWHYIPYRTLRRRPPLDPFRADHSKLPTLSRGYGYRLAQTLLPAEQIARAAGERLLWQTDALRTVEAIRMHAAQTGMLPKALAEIDIVPTPENPATGEPFAYRLKGDQGVLDLPFSDGFAGVAYRFEITLEKR